MISHRYAKANNPYLVPFDKDSLFTNKKEFTEFENWCSSNGHDPTQESSRDSYFPIWSASHGYDSSQPKSYIAYLDANNLYGHSMLQKLPMSNFQWCDNKDINTLIEICGPNGTLPDMGCFVKCDIEYPAELHDLHNDYPLAPERKLVEKEKEHK